MERTLQKIGSGMKPYLAPGEEIRAIVVTHRGLTVYAAWPVFLAGPRSD